MIQRPLLLLLFAYVIGSLLYQMSFVLLVLLLIMMLAGVAAFWYYRSKNSKDYILFIMPGLFILGYLFMGNQQLPGPIDHTLDTGPIHTTCTGTVLAITKTDTSYQLLLSDVSYSDSLIKGQINTSYDPTSNIYVYSKTVPSLAIGNTVMVAGKISHFTTPTNPGQFDERQYYRIQDIDYKMMATEVRVTNSKVYPIRQGLYKLRYRMKDVYDTFKEETASVLNAMLLGDTKNLNKEVKNLYQIGGILHVISISGMHITLLGMAIFTLITRFLGRKWGTLAAVLFIIGYGILTGFRVATNRAVVMMVIFLGAGVVGRTYDLLSAIALSALLILLKQPMQIYQSGFLLSYGAILGIGVSYPILRSLLPVNEWSEAGKRRELSMSSRKKATLHKLLVTARCKLATLLTFQFAIQIFLLPLIIYSYYRIPTYSFLMNLLVVPLMEYVLLFGLPAGVIGCLSLPIGRFFLASANYIVAFCNGLCSILYYLPRYYFVVGKPGVVTLVLYSILILFGLWLSARQRKIGVLCIVAGMLILLLPQPNKGNLTITALDVGQGDGLVIETPDRHVFLVDGGSSDVGEVGTYRILPFLYSNRISYVDYWFVSHCDSDHISGLLEVLQAAGKGECSIGHLLLPDTSFEDENYRNLLACAKENQVPVLLLKRGDTLTQGEVKFTCLHPTYDYPASSANDYSMVLSLSYRGFDMLFTGDIEAEGEDYMKECLTKQYEVLKVAHHGSKSSTTEEVIRKVAPKLGIISCGRDNAYGHPHKEVLDRLTQAQCQFYITMDSGAIEITTDGKQMQVSEFCK